jgi:hypothetical protein
MNHRRAAQFLLTIGTLAAVVGCKSTPPEETIETRTELQINERLVTGGANATGAHHGKVGGYASGGAGGGISGGGNLGGAPAIASEAGDNTANKPPTAVEDEVAEVEKVVATTAAEEPATTGKTHDAAATSAVPPATASSPAPGLDAAAAKPDLASAPSRSPAPPSAGMAVPAATAARPTAAPQPTSIRISDLLSRRASTADSASLDLPDTPAGDRAQKPAAASLRIAASDAPSPVSGIETAQLRSLFPSSGGTGVSPVDGRLRPIQELVRPDGSMTGGTPVPPGLQTREQTAARGIGVLSVFGGSAATASSTSPAESVALATPSTTPTAQHAAVAAWTLTVNPAHHTTALWMLHSIDTAAIHSQSREALSDAQALNKAHQAELQRIREQRNAVRNSLYDWLLAE